MHHRLVVFSAACFGAHIEGKDATNSLALRFLATQAAAFVGSTALAYGGLSEPLQATDYLALLFWTSVRAGRSLGEALRLAKLGLAQEMTRRQGYLDGEDQKAILSFTLFGDPTLVPFPGQKEETGKEGKTGKNASEGRGRSSELARLRLPATPRPRATVHVAENILHRVEREVRTCLPDLGRVEIRAAAPLHCKAVGAPTPGMTLTVAEAASESRFRHLVKVTLAPDGTIQKLVMAHGWGRVLG
jgi:hypothetical protein